MGVIEMYMEILTPEVAKWAPTQEYADAKTAPDKTQYRDHRQVFVIQIWKSQSP